MVSVGIFPSVAAQPSWLLCTQASLLRTVLVREEVDWGRRRVTESRTIDLLWDEWRRGILCKVKVVVRQINLMQSQVRDQLKTKLS